MMKYGVIAFKETTNIGDDIQTYAALKLLPKVDYVIEREELSSFVPSKNELVTTIMSGWYIHDVTALPPSPFINPLVISSHFTDHLLKEKPEYFDDHFLDYLRKFEPIGLRDDLVKKYLDNAGIENYFSGCLTLTIQPFKNIKKTDRICVVDVDGDILKKVRETAGCEVIEETHNLNAALNSKLSFEERMENVETILKKYQSCKLVITSRLHVALPCLSIGAPVLLIYDDANIDVVNRLGNYTKLLNYAGRNEFIKEPNYNITNKKDYLKIREKLLDRVNKFLEESKNKKLSSNEDYSYYNRYFSKQKKRIDEMVKYKNNILEKRVAELEKEYNKLHMLYEINYKENEIRKEKILTCMEENASYRRQIEKIKSLKCYKLLKFLLRVYRKIKRIIKRIFRLGR